MIWDFIFWEILYEEFMLHFVILDFLKEDCSVDNFLEFLAKCVKKIFSKWSVPGAVSQISKVNPNIDHKYTIKSVMKLMKWVKLHIILINVVSAVCRIRQHVVILTTKSSKGSLNLVRSRKCKCDS